MSATEARYKLVSLKKRYVALRTIEILFLSFGSALLIWAIVSFFVNPFVLKFILSLSVGVLVTFERTFRYKLLRLNTQLFVRYLNSHYPQLEESTDLVLKESNSLSRLEQLQLAKTLKEFDSLYPEIKLPQSIMQSLGVFVICLTAYFLLASFAVKNNLSPKEKSIDVNILSKNQSKENANISRLSISIAPPSYTRLSQFESSTPHLVAPEGSVAKWFVNFSSSVNEVKILLSGRDSINLSLTNNVYSAQKQLKESGFYQLQWRDGQKIIRSDYFKIEIIHDQVPKVSIDNLNQFTRLSPSDHLVVDVKSTLADDYGLTDAIIIATVSRGSGEGIKFREEKLRFEKPSTMVGKQVNASVKIDLKKMGMVPGDELYFYVQAWDNKTPIANVNRTETFFIALQDTSKQVAAEDEGLGVDLMPEYFRSQRQIIIDTEKLLREKKKIALQDFKSTSNELGYDQKVLRLRYGQFLGEEFEGQIGKASVVEEESHESTIEKFGHAHDKENEHNLVADKKQTSDSHSHEGEVKDPEAKENPLEAFAHNHDDGEQATFFVQSVRAKLKAALTVMWDAELYLRLYEPAKSLPYQYTALKLLKEISNDSRIYVHRTGFDPPPLKEEKRLTADLNDIRNSTGQNDITQKEVFPEITKALAMIEQTNDLQKFKLTSKNKEQLHRAGQELAMVVIEKPGKFLEGLSLIKKVTDEDVNEKELAAILSKLKTIFWNVRPEQSASPTKRVYSRHPLDQQFMLSLEELPHE
jgi:hypothetical protein